MVRVEVEVEVEVKVGVEVKRGVDAVQVEVQGEGAELEGEIEVVRLLGVECGLQIFLPFLLFMMMLLQLLGVGVVVVVLGRVLGQVVLWLLLVPEGGLGIWGAQVQGHGVGPLAR